LINDKVVAVIGPASSGESAAADPNLESASIPNVTASATNVTLAQHGWKFFHRGLAADDAQGKGDGNYLIKTLGLKTVAVIDDSGTYGEGLADVVRSTIKGDGARDVLDDHIDPKGVDYGSTVNMIVASKAAGVFLGGYYDAAGRLVNQLRSAGYKGVFMSGDGSESPKFISDAGGAPAENAYLSCPCSDVTKLPAARCPPTGPPTEPPRKSIRPRRMTPPTSCWPPSRRATRRLPPSTTTSPATAGQA
jgi:branched-chain amino acid transport system substrate-binding protein